MSVYEKLIKVQSELKAPKSKYNSFGKYNYRSLEDILEGVKPLLVKHKATLIITDSIEQDGDRYYLKATATFIDTEDGQTISNSALAREAADKKGQDDSQITGTASSYARKYALNGLFLIDDTKDADTDEYHKQTNKQTKTEITKENASGGISEDEWAEIEDLVSRANVNKEKLLSKYEIESLMNLTRAQYEALKRKCMEAIKE
jgi:hypothetical protein